MNDGELTGRLQSHIVSVVDPPCRLHQQVVTPFLNLRKAARADGIDGARHCVENAHLEALPSFHGQVVVRRAQGETCDATGLAGA